MTREPGYRIRVRVPLTARTPLHVGGLGTDSRADLPIAVDGAGHPYVPGTSLAGVLRTAAPGLPWGGTPEDRRGPTTSRVTVHDARLYAARGDAARDDAALMAPTVEYRSQVAIDRRTGAAAPGMLAGRAIVPRGSRLTLELDVTSTAATLAADEGAVAAWLHRLADRPLRLGAATSRGLGELVVADGGSAAVEAVVQDLTSWRGLLAALDGDRRGGRVIEWRSPPGGAAPAVDDDLIEIGITWRQEAPILVRAEAEGTFAQTLPLVSAVDGDKVALVLPGSSVKGGLRSHAERIERTVLGRPAASADGDGIAEGAAAVRRQLAELPVTGALFGTHERAGALSVADCYATEPFPAADWAALHQDDDGGAATKAPNGTMRSDHVAIDRWTGGAADGRLFSVLEPHKIEWEPLRLRVDVSRLAEADRDCCLALLLLLLRDVDGGWVQLGGSVTRGCGDIKVAEWSIAGLGGNARTLSDLLSDTALTSRLGAEWRTYAGDGRLPSERTKVSA